MAVSAGKHGASQLRWMERRGTTNLLFLDMHVLLPPRIREIQCASFEGFGTCCVLGELVFFLWFVWCGVNKTILSRLSCLLFCEEGYRASEFSVIVRLSCWPDYHTSTGSSHLQSYHAHIIWSSTTSGYYTRRHISFRCSGSVVFVYHLWCISGSPSSKRIFLTVSWETSGKLVFVGGRR